MNFIDTAEMYPVPPNQETYTTTEQYIGAWIQARGRRDDIVLASKIAGPTGNNNLDGYIRGGNKIFRARKSSKPATPASNGCTPITSTFTNCTGPSAKPIFSANSA